MKRLLLQAYDTTATRLHCCIIGIGCGFAIIVSGSALTGLVGYGTWQVLT